jgi:hypothetical protein
MKTAEMVQYAAVLTEAMQPVMRAQIASLVLAQLAAARVQAFEAVTHEEMQEDAEMAVDYAGHLLAALSNPHFDEVPR